MVFAIAARFLPHPPNFAPIAAIALFGVCFLPKRLALILPLLAMLISDFFIGFYHWPVMLAVYSSFLLVGLWGFWLKKRLKWHNTIFSAFLAGLVFFLITNFAVWVFTPWYSKTIAGLTQCFIMALPFFKNTLLGNLFYVSSLFGAYQLVLFWFKQKQRSLCKLAILKK